MPRDSDTGDEANRQRDHIDQGTCTDLSEDIREDIAGSDDRPEHSDERVAPPITSRRSFVRGTAAAAAGLSIVSGQAAAQSEGAVVVEVGLPSDAGGRATFTVETDGEFGEPDDRLDEISSDGSTYEGVVGAGRDDRFEMTGSLTDFSADNDNVRLSVDDQFLDIDSLEPIESQDVDGETVRVSAPSSNDGEVRYLLVADGRFGRTDDVDTRDRIVGRDKLRGTVVPGSDDRFVLDGELQRAVVRGSPDNEIEVFVDGERFDQSGDEGDGDDGDTADRDDEDAFPEDGWRPSGIDPEDLTDKSRGQLIAAIPSEFKRAIGRADLLSPMSVLEAQQNNTEPARGENGIVLYRAIDGGADMEYTLRVNNAENDDLNDLTQGHIHHAPRGASDNRLFFHLFIRSDLDGSDGTPENAPLTVSKTLSEALEDALEASERLDDGFRQEDPEVPEFTEDDPEAFVADLTQDMLDNPGGYINNAHTVVFQTEAIRGQIRLAELGDLSKSELVEVVLATAGLSAL